MNIKFSAKEEKEDRIEEKGFQFEYCYLMAIRLLEINNKFRTQDRAIISFRKVRK